ncbi:hypothetical protein K469DRAFT_752883 [Zopfia rhizophila CBS 207.26]|uniref:Uncharacterized protein n=1 Tax=Zopfia rhizophila CBS 207.26 TaxID=1314779 RepID=A0A6A6DUR5_9PEZI|nr:hypothetical protein K469DRAFT_752883 [Zopfia rhizophila CBS 207.26]
MNVWNGWRMRGDTMFIANSCGWHAALDSVVPAEHRYHYSSALPDPAIALKIAVLIRITKTYGAFPPSLRARYHATVRCHAYYAQGRPPILSEAPLILLYSLQRAETRHLAAARYMETGRDGLGEHKDVVGLIRLFVRSGERTTAPSELEGEVIA